MKPETRFRVYKVNPFLKTLKNTAFFTIQQKSIGGTPDDFLCVNGLFVGMEIKIDEGVVSALQKIELRRIHRCKGLAMVVSPSNWEAAKALLTALDQGDLHGNQNEIFGNHEWRVTANA